MGLDELYVWVYHYEAPEDEAESEPVSYRTRESIETRGGSVLPDTARQVPGYEIIEGLWKPGWRRA